MSARPTRARPDIGRGVSVLLGFLALPALVFAIPGLIATIGEWANPATERIVDDLAYGTVACDGDTPVLADPHNRPTITSGQACEAAAAGWRHDRWRITAATAGCIALVVVAFKTWERWG